MTDPATPTAKPAFGSDASPVLAKLRAHREQHGGDVSFVLKSTGVTVTYPKFRPYDLWQKAQRIGGKDSDRMQLHYITALCRFEGERLRASDYAELIPADDHLDIIGRVFGGAASLAKELGKTDAADDDGIEAGAEPGSEGKEPAAPSPGAAPAARPLGALGPAPSTTASSSAAAIPIPS